VTVQPDLIEYEFHQTVVTRAVYDLATKTVLNKSIVSDRTVLANVVELTEQAPAVPS
jgi:hypothetical protein